MSGYSDCWVKGLEEGEIKDNKEDGGTITQNLNGNHYPEPEWEDLLISMYLGGYAIPLCDELFKGGNPEITYGFQR